MSEPRAKFDENIWRARGYWSQNYDSGSEPKDEREALTRNAQTVRDALSGQPESDWNDGTYGDCACDHSTAEDDFANVIPETQDDCGVRYASAEEVQRYYDQTVPTDVQILKGDDEDGN